MPVGIPIVRSNQNPIRPDIAFRSNWPGGVHRLRQKPASLIAPHVIHRPSQSLRFPLQCRPVESPPKGTPTAPKGDTHGAQKGAKGDTHSSEHCMESFEIMSLDGHIGGRRWPAARHATQPVGHRSVVNSGPTLTAATPGSFNNPQSPLVRIEPQNRLTVRHSRYKQRHPGSVHGSLAASRGFQGQALRGAGRAFEQSSKLPHQVAPAICVDAQSHNATVCAT